MSAVAINGEEDDDFAYEDEHIELESENQEYDDLAESEFEKTAQTGSEPTPSHRLLR